jgi:Tol biopolymer transport system component
VRSKIGLIALLFVLAGAATASAEVRETQLVSTGGNGPFTAMFASANADASHVFWTTGEKLVPGDTDSRVDLYEHSPGVTKLVSTSATAGNGPYDSGIGNVKVSADGSRVFFLTNEQLVPEDTDNGTDVYERAGGTTTLVSKSSTTGGPQFFLPRIHAVSEDGSTVYFKTDEALLPVDGDSGDDLYKWSAGALSLVSAYADGSNGSGTFEGATPDGSKVFFQSTDRLVPEDTDTATDIYELGPSGLRRVTDAPYPGGDAHALFLGMSRDGSHIFFRTVGALTPNDANTAMDIYDVSGGTNTLISTRPDGQPETGTTPVNFQAVSADGSHVYFRTQFTGEQDSLYEHVAGTTTPIVTTTSGTFAAGGATPDGSHFYFVTSAGLVPADTDPGHEDVYDWSGGSLSLVSVGSGGSSCCTNARFAAATDDGDRVFFETYEQLVPADTDTTADIYERHAGTTTLISVGPASGTGSPQGMGFGAMSPDGSRVVFGTYEPLTYSDTDGSQGDMYDSHIVDTTGYARPKGATPIFAALVPAFQPCTTPNRTHGSPLAFGSCAPPGLQSPNLTVGTGDANGQAVGMVGWVAVNAIPGDPLTPADDADLHFQLSLKDVRRQSDLEDYTGSVKVQTSVRLTDKDGGIPNTAADFPISFDAPCTATASTSIGSTCAGITTADALAPGSVVESARSIWALGRVEVYDGGSDGDPTTAGNSLFAVQGVFVP